MENTGRQAWVFGAIAAVMLVAMLGWNIAQQREIGVLREDVKALEQRLLEGRRSELSGVVSGIAEIAANPAPSPRPARTKAKAGGKAKARTDAEPRARAAKAEGRVARAGKAKAKARAEAP